MLLVAQEPLLLLVVLQVAEEPVLLLVAEEAQEPVLLLVVQVAEEAQEPVLLLLAVGGSFCNRVVQNGMQTQRKHKKLTSLCFQF